MTDWATEPVEQWEVLVVVLALALKLWVIRRRLKAPDPHNNRP